MLKIASLLIVAMLLHLHLKAKQDNRPAAVLMEYGRVDDSFQTEGLALRECLLIRNDGHYYFESRRQRLPEPGNTLTSYAGSLDQRSMEELRRILNDPSVVASPEYVGPRFPLHLRGLEVVSVELPLGTTERTIGYFRTRQAMTSDEQQKASAASAVLEPLSSWFAQFKNGSLQRVPNFTESCHRPLEQ
jgi:hypothetical protein